MFYLPCPPPPPVCPPSPPPPSIADKIGDALFRSIDGKPPNPPLPPPLPPTPPTDQPPSHIPSPPSAFGTAPLSASDETALRLKKKDLRHNTSVDLTLRFLTRFHASHLHKFTEDALRQALLILAPESILYHAETMVHASLPLSTIYSSLFRHFGTAKSIKSLRQQLASIVDDPLNDPLIVLDSIKALLRTSPESMLEFDSTCLLEATRYIQRIAGESIACNIDSILTNSRDISFLNFYEIVTTNFSKTLSDIGKARKRYTHHLHSDPPHDPYPPPATPLTPQTPPPFLSLTTASSK